jgi:hypothetical protein
MFMSQCFKCAFCVEVSLKNGFNLRKLNIMMSSKSMLPQLRPTAVFLLAADIEQPLRPANN